MTRLREWQAVLYGAVAGLLLYDNPYAAGAVMAPVWLAAMWRLREA